MLRRNVQKALCGVTLLALASLYLSYRTLIRSVESAATEAGLLDGELIVG